MYTARNFQTKKALKEALERGELLSVFQPGPFPAQTDGWITLEGPHYPQPHKWYAQALIENSYIIKLKG